MISSVGSGGGGPESAFIQQARSRAADRLFQKIDANRDGRITQDELSRAMGASGKQGAGAAVAFQQLDQGGKGYISRQDLEDGMAKADQATQAQAQQKGVARAGKGEGGGGGGAPVVASPDPEDLNQDGRVTMQEKLQYAEQRYAARQQARTGNQVSAYF